MKKYQIIPNIIYENLISEIQIPRIDLVQHILNIFVVSVCQNDIANLLELVKITDNTTVEEAVLLHSRLVNNDFNAFCFDPLHNALDRRLTEVITSRLHGQTVHADNFRVLGNDLIGDKVLAGAVRRDDCRDDILRNIVIVGK